MDTVRPSTCFSYFHFHFFERYSLTIMEFKGACEGTLACSTCHLIFKKEDYEKLPDTPSDEELDMLDLAYGLCET